MRKSDYHFSHFEQFLSFSFLEVSAVLQPATSGGPRNGVIRPRWRMFGGGGGRWQGSGLRNTLVQSSGGGESHNMLPSVRDLSLILKRSATHRCYRSLVSNLRSTRREAASRATQLDCSQLDDDAVRIFVDMCQNSALVVRTRPLHPQIPYELTGRSTPGRVLCFVTAASHCRARRVGVAADAAEEGEATLCTRALLVFTYATQFSPLTLLSPWQYESHSRPPGCLPSCFALHRDEVRGAQPCM